jgi:hypothetical protein
MLVGEAKGNCQGSVVGEGCGKLLWVRVNEVGDGSELVSEVRDLRVRDCNGYSVCGKDEVLSVSGL